MQNELRDYIKSQPNELRELLDAARDSGMKVFVEVNENFPPSFIDTVPLLAAICKKFSVATTDLDLLCSEFCQADRTVLRKLNTFSPSSQPHEVTASFLLMVAIARRNRQDLGVMDLQGYGWHVDAAKVVLSHDS
ncbi:TPA: hypothetical protein UM350_003295 [Stenotrophomonas maltophilia]|uniref:hypothetical protein n=1 Tax=Stenotrophomonas maltophilia TaxID=40324 RepID=UPI00066E1C2C|nr:hypothetical protein [Stenotrophomonas maltophilia]MBH1464008.1 hypothetical protein [Stenotrophomonas maltophilia]MBH1615799.1 hypothetical protein [Stenotrophomonas maltophilia]MBN5123605.1 hypothetical protein [Stenotrophomonas maltophilia]MBN5166792.1 hypothetical protein [Stenotrophomonas maltophilia]MBO3002866.1 hypothetical protein [Stenotrophomonas maltophilia]